MPRDRAAEGRGNVLALKLDGGELANHALFPLFQQLPGVTAICDYLFFAQKDPGSPLYVLLCELKSARKPHAAPQLRNTSLLAEYLVAMAIHHGKGASAPEVCYRGVVFHPGGAPRPKGNLYQIGCAFLPLPDARPAMGIAHYEPGGAAFPLSHFCR